MSWWLLALALLTCLLATIGLVAIASLLRIAAFIVIDLWRGNQPAAEGTEVRSACHDPDWGLIEYQAASGLWVREPVSVGGAGYAVYVEAPETGPSEAQRAFWRQLQERWTDLESTSGELAELKPRLRSEAGHWAPAADAQFALYAVLLQLPPRWKAEFTRTDLDEDLVYVIEFENWEISSIRAED